MEKQPLLNTYVNNVNMDEAIQVIEDVEGILTRRISIQYILYKKKRSKLLLFFVRMVTHQKHHQISVQYSAVAFPISPALCNCS